MKTNIHEKMNYSRVITMMGAILAFTIGSGFATGQELLQYITAYGYQGILVGIVFFIIFTYSNYSYARAGNINKFTKGADVYKYFCGDVVGTIFDYFSVVFCYMSFIVMLGGASATLEQKYGLPLYLGGLILTILATSTVVFGLDALVNILGKVGPIIVIICLTVGIISLVRFGENIPESARLIETGEVKVMQASTNWLFAGGSYAGFVMLWFGGFMAELGAKNRLKDLTVSIVSSSVFYIIGVLVVGFALLANISSVAGTQIPNLILVEQTIPILASVFTIVVFAALYTTSVPLLWTAATRFSKEKTNKFYILTILLAILGYFISMRVPFDRLLNVVYVINGYVGIILLGFMIYKDIKMKNEMHVYQEESRRDVN